MAAAQSIIFICFPFDENRTILYTMFELTKSKHAAVRSKAAEFIQFMIQNVSLLEVRF